MCFLPIYGQKQGNIWFFGEGAGLDFNGSAPTPISGGQIYGNPQGPMDHLYNEGCATISDSSGNLLFYSNGEKVWNRNHQIMPNGDGLYGHYSATHAAYIVPKPLSDSLFYLFTLDGMQRNLQYGLRYSIINMCLDGGLGDVIPGKKNIPLLQPASEKIVAIYHTNGKDIWIVSHEFFTDAFFAFLLTETGITDTVISNTGSVHIGLLNYFNGTGAGIGQIKATSDGNKIALVFSNAPSPVGELFDFNNVTGIISNAISLDVDGAVFGVEFSPDNSKLYITSLLGGLHQFDITAGGGTSFAINASKIQIDQAGCSERGLQLAPDGKIYMKRCIPDNHYLSVVNNPNATGNLCDYVNSAIDFDTVQTGIPPTFIQGYQYNNETYDCDTVCDEFNNSISLDFEIDSVTCNNSNNGVIKSVVASNYPPLEYFWSDENDNVFSHDSIVSNMAPGTYFLKVVDQNNCVMRDTIILSNPNPLNFDLGPDDTICNTLFQSIDAGNYTKYIWSTGDTTRVINIQLSGNYSVTVTDSNGCLSVDSVNIFIKNDTASVYLGEDTTINQHASIQLNSHINGVLNYPGEYTWYPSHLLNCEKCPDPTATLSESGPIILNYSRDGICFNSDTLYIEVMKEYCYLYMPNGFSPNNDGINDYYKPVYKCVDNWTFQIFDRWGELVFESTKVGEYWDGLYNNQELNPGVFVYLIKATFINGNVVTKSGSVTMLK